jgi:hypothetical protein
MGVVVAQASVGGNAVAEDVAGGGDEGLDGHGRFLDRRLAQDWTWGGVVASAACAGLPDAAIHAIYCE